MPLMHGKSEKAFKQNVRTEMHHDKPLKQSLAIAYAIKKKAAQQHKAHGGEMCAHGKMMGECMEPHEHYEDGGPVMDPVKTKHFMEGFKKPMAEGGEIHHEEMMEYDPVENPEEHKMNMEAEMEDEHMIDKIMKQRKGYSKGGQVANDVGEGEDADMEPNQFDDLVKEDELEAHYPGSEEIGDEQEDMDRHDMISKIMKDRKMKKNHNPRPA